MGVDSLLKNKMGSHAVRRPILGIVAGAAVVVSVFSSGASIAQETQPTKSSEFEVAAIKPSDPTHIGSLIQGSPPGGPFRMVSVPLKRWVEIGLSVQDFALRAPAWLDDLRFDLNSRPPANQSATPEMMKHLLVERFGLKWHEETGTVSGYELVSDKKVLAQPAGLLERLENRHGWSSGPGLIGGTNMPMSEFAEALAKVLKRPVIDETHLSGGFDIRLMWRLPDDAVVAEERRHGIDVDNLPGSVFTAVREQLGLRLQKATVPSRVIVVDQIARQPTAN